MNLTTDLTAQQLVGVGIALGGVAPAAVPVPVPVPTPVPLPAPGPAAGDGNVYPLMPAAGATGDITLGVGPDPFAFRISNPPGAAVGSQFNIAVNINTPGAKLLAKDIAVTSNLGEAGGQLVTLNGNFGEGAIFALVGSGVGLQDCFIRDMTYRDLPYYDFSMDNSRSDQASFDGVKIYNSAHASTLIIGPWKEPAVPAAPVAVDTVIAGAMVLAATNIPGSSLPQPTTPGILSALVAALLIGTTLSLPAGAFVGTTKVPVPITIDGAGMGKTIFNLTGHALAENKAAFLPLVAGSVFSNMSVCGCRLPDGLGANGAAFRDEGNGVGFTLVNIEVFDNDNGILTFGSDINLKACNFHGCGSALPSGIGRTHNKYVGGNMVQNADGTWTAATNHLFMQDCIGSGATQAHDTKSRAGYTTLINDKSTAGGNGRCLDVPDGGIVAVSGGTWTIPAGAASLVFFGHSSESTINKATGNTVTFTNHTFDNQSGRTAYIILGDPTSIVNFSGCPFLGAPIVFQCPNGTPTILIDGKPYAAAA